MPRAIRIGLWILAVLAVLLAGTYAYLRNADLSVYETQIEGILSEAVGHRVDIDGLFELHFGKVINVIAEEITVSNPNWSSEPIILSVGHFSVSVDLWSLFRGPIVIENMDVQRVRVRLERNEQAGANWDNGRTQADDQPKEAFDRNLIAFRELRIQDVQLAYIDDAREQPLNANLSYLTITPDATNVLDLDLRATINEIPLWADGKLGPWTNLIDGKDVSADLNLFLGESSLAIDGFIADLVSLEGIETSLKLRGPAIERITNALGIPPFAEGEFEVTGKIDAVDNGNLVNVDGKLGAITIFASGNIDRFIAPGRAEFDFNFAGPDAKYVGEVFGLKNVRQAPFQVSGQFNLDGKRYALTETEAQFAAGVVGIDGWIDLSREFPDGDITINSSGPDLSVVGALSGTHGIPAEAFELHGRIQKSGAAWQIDDFNFTVGANRLVVRGELNRGSTAGGQIDVAASGPDISILQDMAGLQGLPAKPFDVSVRLKPDRAGLRLENAVAVFGDNRLEIDGPLGVRDGLTGTDLRIRASGPELHNVALLTGVPYLPSGPFELTGRALIRNDTLRIENARAAVQGIDATADGTIGLVPVAEEFDLKLSASGTDLAGLAPIDFLQKFSGERFEVSGRLGRKPGRFKLDSINASVGSLRAAVDGELASDGTTADLRLSVDAPDAAVLEMLSGMENLPEGPVHAGGRIEKAGSDLEFSDTEFRIGEYRFSTDGRLSRSPRSNRSNLRFAASGPELRQLGLPFGYAALPAKTFSLSGEVNGVPAGFAIEKLVARIGENDIVGEFTADLRGKPEITGIISATYIDLESPILQSPESESEEEPEVAREFLFSNEPLGNAWLQFANFDLDLTSGRAILTRADVHDVHIHTRLWDGRLDIDPLVFRELDGSVAGQLHIEPASNGYSLDASLTVENMHLGITASADHDRTTLPPLSGNAVIGGSGNSLHELLASSNGKVDFQNGAGEMERSWTAHLFGDLVTEVLRSINPLSKPQTRATLECGVYRIDINDGVATIDNVAFQSDRLTIIASGNVDFETEQLDLSMKVMPREGFGVSLGSIANSLMKLGGTLQEPKVQIDAASSVKTTGVAVATGGLSLIARGLLNRVSPESDLCAALNEESN